MAAADKFKERYEILFDDLVASKQETMNLGRNFLAADKLFYDVSARLFRKLIEKEKREKGIPLPFRPDKCGKKTKEQLEAIKELEELDFSYLGECLNRFESISERCWFFDCLPLEVDKAIQQSKSVPPVVPRVLLKPTSDDFMLVPVADRCKVVVHRQQPDPWSKLDISESWKSILSNDSGSYFLDVNVFEQIKSTCESKGVKISIYRLTVAWDAVQFIRDKRNSVVGHPSSTNLNDDALDDLFKEVLEQYKKLPAWISENDYMAEVEKIKDENKKKLMEADDVKIALEKLLAVEGKYYKDWVNGRFDGLEERVDDHDGKIEGLKNQLDDHDGRIEGVEEREEVLSKKVMKLEQGLAREIEEKEELKRQMLEQQAAKKQNMVWAPTYNNCNFTVCLPTTGSNTCLPQSSDNEQSVDQFAARIRSVIEKALSETSPMTVAEIVEATHYKEEEVHSAITDMESDKVVRVNDDHPNLPTYQLISIDSGPSERFLRLTL